MRRRLMLSRVKMSSLGCVSAILWSICASMVVGAESISIVKEGEANASIVYSLEGRNIAETRNLKRATAALQEYVKKSSGAELKILEEAPASGNVIYVGNGSWIEKFGITLDDKLHPDAFEILFPDERSIVIIGKGCSGTEFGVYGFLERYLGVRWLTPGDVGTHIPEHKNIKIPAVKVVENPVFIDRRFSGLVTKDARKWQLFNKTGAQTVRFHHGMWKLFPASKYAKSHPEYYPLIDGKRYQPENDRDQHWQPCFSNPATVDVAAKTIIEFFDKHPNAPRTFSLGVNDGDADQWCKCKQCKAKYSEKESYSGAIDYSNIYYDWCNKVIEKVLKKYPDAWFGCLAYNNVISPPDFKLSPHLVPFICRDRLMWSDPGYEKDDKAFHAGWEKKADNIGWYDYVYGRKYSLPRVYMHQYGKVLKYGSKNGVKWYYAEAYPPENPVWGEGPKLYMMSKQLWNPNIDTDKMLDEWYTCYVGKDAAADLKRYYEFWEDFWTERMPPSKWFQETKKVTGIGAHFLDFTGSGYYDVLSFEDISKCKALLESALSKTKTKKQRARMEGLIDSFKQAEAIKLCFMINKSNESPNKVLTKALENNSLAPGLKNNIRQILNVLNGKVKALNRNPDFAGNRNKGNRPPSWTMWKNRKQGELKWMKSPDSGGNCIKMEHCYQVGLFNGLLNNKGVPQRDAIENPKPGKYLVVAKVLAQGPMKGIDRTWIRFIFNAQLRKRIQLMKKLSFTVDLLPQKGQKTLIYMFDVPAKVAGKKVDVMNFGVRTVGMREGQILYVQKLALYPLN